MPRGAGMVFLGPAVLILLLAVFSCAVLTAAWSRHLDGLLALGARARARCDRDRALPMLWGLSAATLVFAVAAVLVRSHVLALLGIVLLLAGMVILSLGLAVAAWALGGVLAASVGGENDMPRALRLGLIGLLLASLLPYVGWLLCLVGVASGTGAVLEALVGRD